MIILGACYEYDIVDNKYDTDAGFLWKWKNDRSIKYFHDSNKEKFNHGDSEWKANGNNWKNLGFMGHNFLYNDDGIVFSVPLALSQFEDGDNTGVPTGGSESGTIILKTERGKRFL
jgi:hypothetical protein